MPQLLSLRSRSQELQLLGPHALESLLRSKRSHHSENPMHLSEEQPPLTAIGETCSQQERPSTAINKIKGKKNGPENFQNSAEAERSTEQKQSC